MDRVKTRRRTNRNQPIHYFGFQTALFLTLVTVYCLERVVSPTIIASDLTCVGQRTVLLGETALETGFYHGIALIATICIGLAGLEYGLNNYSRIAPRRKMRWGIPVVNILLGIGLLAIIATPWAYYNVDDPLADRIYQGRALIAPDIQFADPGLRFKYDVNPYIWSCDVGSCDGDPMNTVSTYHHRHLPISYRFVVYHDCMSAEFNLATMRAIDADLSNWDGDRRRTARVFFDQDGRFIGPNNKPIKTALMRANLSETERLPSPVSFDHAMTQLANWDDAFYNSPDLPTWVDWTILSKTIRSGKVYTIYRTTGLMVGVRLIDGTEMIGTQTQIGDLDRLLEDCGIDCDGIAIRH